MNNSFDWFIGGMIVGCAVGLLSHYSHLRVLRQIGREEGRECIMGEWFAIMPERRCNELVTSERQAAARRAAATEIGDN
jgi:hypothetical protein